MVPDLAGWRRERMPIMPDVPFFEMAPDWLCEVSSPSTAVLDRRRKMPHYARAAVRHLWIIDPVAKMLEVYRSEGEHWLLLGAHSGDDKVRAEPFDAIELDLSVLWAR
jgi:Uma2 family endonuclease